MEFENNQRARSSSYRQWYESVPRKGVTVHPLFGISSHEEPSNLPPILACSQPHSFTMIRSQILVSSSRLVIFPAFWQIRAKPPRPSSRFNDRRRSLFPLIFHILSSRVSRAPLEGPPGVNICGAWSNIVDGPVRNLSLPLMQRWLNSLITST
jgi:hypothetical protein